MESSADGMSARTPLGDARSQHHDETAGKSSSIPDSRSVAEAPSPEWRHPFSGTIAGKLRTQISTDENSKYQHPFPVDFRRLVLPRLLRKIGILLRHLGNGGLTTEGGSIFEGRSDSQLPVRRKKGKPAQDTDTDSNNVRGPSPHSKRIHVGPFSLQWFDTSRSAGCSKPARSSHPQQAPRRRGTLWGINSATPHKAACEDGGEMAGFQQPKSIFFRAPGDTSYNYPLSGTPCSRRDTVRSISRHTGRSW